jgi:predicted phage terminase large subunit-like protein
VHKFATTAHGFRFATSVGGSVTGEGGDILIVDDPHNPSHIHARKRREATLEWFDTTWMSRLNDKAKGAAIVVMQRLHEHDLAGHLLAKGAGVWHHLSLPASSDTKRDLLLPIRHYQVPAYPALQPEREDPAVLAQVRAEMGYAAFYAQYLQTPLPATGNLIKREWLQLLEVMPESPRQIIQSWDTATEGGEQHDYSVCTTWYQTETGWVLVDVLRERLDFPALQQRLQDHAALWKAQMIILEKQASGAALYQFLRRTVPTLPLVPFLPKHDKHTRLATASTWLESGVVRLYQGRWLAAYLHELLAFPNAEHDDQVDSTSQAILWMQKRAPMKLGIERVG